MTIQTGPLMLEGAYLYFQDKQAPVRLHRKEYRLLKLFMEHPNQVVTRAKLMKEIWQTDYMGDTRTLDVHICWLRHKIESDPTQPKLLVTHRGVGYRLCVSDKAQ